MSVPTNAMHTDQPTMTAAPNAATLKLEPYLHFDGTCEEALRFYGDVFGGSVTAMMRWEDAPAEMGVPPDRKHKIMHANFKSPALEFMASDGTPGTVESGSRISLSLGTRDVDEAKRLFQKLGAGGNVSMPLQDTFWGALFGMVTDKYGIDWMVNADKS